MNQLTNYLNEAQKGDWAIPHFNISTFDQLQVIIEVATELKSPVLIGVSEGEVDFLGYESVRLMIDFWKQKTDLPIFLNADHHHSLERAKLAIDAGFDSVNIDCSLKSAMENEAETRAVVEYAKQQNPSINIEGEMGALATQSSEINAKDIMVDESQLTTPQDARQFVEVTKVDRLTPAVGNFHGLVKPGNHPKKLNIERLTEIQQAVTVPLTLHGGSGLSDLDIQQALPLVSNIHINTELRVAYTQGIQKEIGHTTTPYKYLSAGHDPLKKVIVSKINLFGSHHRARV
jgi:fructose-bisphosphate aldolase class II